MSERETALKEPCPHCGRTDYRWTQEFRVGLSFDRLEVRCDYCRPLRMDAYYFGFTETGVLAIDRILSAVAQAGKGYHHTESWGEDGLEDMGQFYGGSYVAWIQNAANDAAKAFAALPVEGDAPQVCQWREIATAPKDADLIGGSAGDYRWDRRAGVVSGDAAKEQVMVLSQRFIGELRDRLARGERQYRIARRAGVHPTTLSQIVNDAVPLRPGDSRVLKVGRELGLEPEDCFTNDRGAA